MQLGKTLFKLLIPVVFVLLVGCTGSSSDKESNTTSAVSGLPAPTPVKVAYSLPTSFKEQLQKTISAYLATKDALVASNSQQANTSVGDLIVALQQTDTTGLPAEALPKWTEHRKIVQRAATTLQATPKIADKRIQFDALSKAMYALVKDFGASSTLYKEYCPMAMNDKGAFWLSAGHEIRNPYFGEKMLECGEVQEVLTFK